MTEASTSSLDEGEVWCRRCPAPATETYNEERLCHDCAATLAYKPESNAWRVHWNHEPADVSRRPAVVQTIRQDNRAKRP